MSDFIRTSHLNNRVIILILIIYHTISNSFHLASVPPITHVCRSTVILPYFCREMTAVFSLISTVNGEKPERILPYFYGGRSPVARRRITAFVLLYFTRNCILLYFSSKTSVIQKTPLFLRYFAFKNSLGSGTVYKRNK